MTDFLEYLQSISEKIQTIDAVEALEHHKATDICFVDLRDGFELRDYGIIPGAMHCPRGSLEFRIPADSDYHHSFFHQLQALCVLLLSWSALYPGHAIPRKNWVLKMSAHIRGGMIAWVKSGRRY